MNLEKLNHINQLIMEDMLAVDAMIRRQMDSKVALVNQLGDYIINSGGKRIRPMVALLVARTLDYQGDKHIDIATLIEFIHIATLLHDDVVDESDLRRGKKTPNTVFGNTASILVGDFIYTRAFQMMTRLGSMRVFEVMSTATNMIAAGEVQQLMNCNNPNITEKDYMSVIYDKTARLFEAASQSSAILAGASTEQELALQCYGCHLGTAFQLIDDLLDYSSEGNTLGKNVGDDLNEGKVTLPLLHAIQHGTEKQAAMIRQAIRQGNSRHVLTSVLEVMQECKSLDYTRQRAQEEIDKAITALKKLPANDYCAALKDIAHFAINRFF